MSAGPPIVGLDRGHVTRGFRSGAEELDQWLRHSARQNARRSAVRVRAAIDDRHVVGYHALVAGHVRLEDATEAVRRALSRHHPIPIARLVRLAIDERWQGRGLGRRLIQDAGWVTINAAESIGIRALVVDARDEKAAAFYEVHGFERLADDPLCLMVPLGVLRDALGPLP